MSKKITFTAADILTATEHPQKTWAQAILRMEEGEHDLDAYALSDFEFVLLADVKSHGMLFHGLPHGNPLRKKLLKFLSVS